MKAIQTGHNFRIYDDSMKLYDTLPAQAYRVEFSQMSGFSLSLFSDIEVNEKIYGVHLAKVNKTLAAFKNFQRNLGVILSGDKGIGKSLFSKVLAQEAIKAGYPLLIVNHYVPGIADFINDIEQEVVVLFDEFDKTFPNSDGQAEMLTLFDGISQGKKLFCVTCNDLSRLNSYLVNRPGRFHYHYRFDYPTPAEIREYLEDKLAETFYGEIDKVIHFSNKINLNYDCLRAIAFELNSGMSFEVAIQDLNILRTFGERYTAMLLLDDGTKMRLSVCLDLFDGEEVYLEFEDEETGYDVFDVTFHPADNKYDPELGTYIAPEDLKVSMMEYLKTAISKNGPKWKEGMLDSSHLVELRNKYEKKKPIALLLKRQMAKGLHYTL